MNQNDTAIELSEKLGGKVRVIGSTQLTKENLAILYTPGVADVARAVAENPELARKYTIKKNSVLVVSDGSAVLGLGNIGPLGALPVMEGKALLFHELGGLDAIPLVLDTQDTEEIIKTIKNIAPAFAGINIEDISAPRCFEIEERLKQELDIPVFHDDQHGTAIVVLAALTNALKIVDRKLSEISIVVAGAGAAGTAISKLLHLAGAQDIIVTDTQGAIYSGRPDLSGAKAALAEITNPRKVSGTLSEVIAGAHVFIGVSSPNILTAADVATMSDKAIVFAMGNPTPEIHPDEARAGGAYIIATGRSDFPNQINNLLAFPGIFRGAIDARVRMITDEHKLRAAYTLAAMIPEPRTDLILPDPLDPAVVPDLARIFIENN
jgi:malate dehydrogenase (oxaloacetate-decarboxylating)